LRKERFCRIKRSKHVFEIERELGEEIVQCPLFDQKESRLTKTKKRIE